ncbi:sensor histidine kinase [Segatella buccae]|uniref:sensor histidine kinase n=1 Tax=Segatella buccae TaxID=28126 RepID=UPI000AA9477C|nr:HAMP domain-containing sensor histidine kinase [Segatella buccae]
MIDYRYDADLTDSRSYLLVMPTTRLVVLRQMSGILATSLVILAIIVLVFWFLIHTIMKQKTLDEMKSDFTNNMTHELKTPIAVAYAANDALLNFDEGISREKQREYLQIGRQQLEKLGGLVEQILAMSMERRKTLTLDMERVELEPLVRPMIATYRLKADKAVDIELVTEPASAAVWADRSHLQHIIGNLIDNAVKYSGPSVTIRIVCTEGCISVGDNGIGIDSAQLPYLFNKFYRVHQGDRQDVQGYGLGLYYAKSLMEHMGGTIAVESTPGRGTTFTLNFKTP